MENYVFINGRKTIISDEQAEALAAIVPEARKMELSPSEVSRIVREGEARNHFKIHDVLRFGELELEVIGFDHDKHEDNPDRPTMTVLGKQIIERRAMHRGDCPRGWIDADLRKWLNEEALFSLPGDLREVIIPVKRHSVNSEGKLFVTVDRLFVPSESELFGSAILSAREAGERYEAFATSEDRVRFDADGDSWFWWCSSSRAGYSGTFTAVTSGGHPSLHAATYAYVGAPLCFSF